jgi:hypothetical protein
MHKICSVLVIRISIFKEANVASLAVSTYPIGEVALLESSTININENLALYKKWGEEGDYSVNYL